MTLQEVRDTVYSRLKQRQNDIYALSSMIRVAVLSCFVPDVSFPAPPAEEQDEDNRWRNSYNYMAELAKIHKPKGGAKK